MSCTQYPVLCGKPEFRLKNPMAAPPLSGWRIIKLPYQAAALQGAWTSFPGEPDSAKGAWGQLLGFLQANKIKVPFDQIEQESIEQWCDPDPKRCRGYRKINVRLKWAKERWEWANRLLVQTDNPGETLQIIVNDLTERINGPAGCVHCALHWVEVLRNNPVPENPTLTEARHWLVDRHNDTRENLEPVVYESIAHKFNWVTA